MNYNRQVVARLFFLGLNSSWRAIVRRHRPVWAVQTDCLRLDNTQSGDWAGFEGLSRPLQQVAEAADLYSFD
jgi:hypothetical protein